LLDQYSLFKQRGFLNCEPATILIACMIMNAQIDNRYVLGHLDVKMRARFWTGIAISVLLFMSMGSLILKPWDPYGAICLQLVENDAFFLARITGLLLAVGVFASIIIDARLPLFGTFAACVGMAIPIVKTAGMDYVMVRLQAEGKALEHPQDLWGNLALETLLWSVVLAVLLIGTMLTEQWLNKSHQNSTPPASPEPGKKKRSSLFWLKGLGGIVITVILALFLIAILAANIRKGQIVFATIVGFYLASLTAEQIAENDHPIWQVLAVPIVAFIAYIYTWFHPDRPPGLESILHIAPNGLARILSVEYIFLGTIGAIFGNWTSHKVRHNKQHG